MHPRLGAAVALLLEQAPAYREHAALAALRAEGVAELAQAQSIVHGVVDVIARTGVQGEELAALAPGASLRLRCRPSMRTHGCGCKSWLATATHAVIPVVMDVIIDRLLGSEHDLQRLYLLEALFATARIDGPVFEEFLLVRVFRCRARCGGDDCAASTDKCAHRAAVNVCYCRPVVRRRHSMRARMFEARLLWSRFWRPLLPRTGLSNC